VKLVYGRSTLYDHTLPLVVHENRPVIQDPGIFLLVIWELSVMLTTDTKTL
jgi:hypothetical protein